MFRVFKTKILKAIVINLVKKESCNFLYLSKKTIQCGLTLKEYEINPEIGTGKIISYSFNGLVIKDKIKFRKNTSIKKLSLAKNIITENLNTQYSISEISKKIFLNESIFKNEFKRTFGESFFKYSLNLRMKEAKKLLAYTSIPIGEISELIGYKNPTHFTAAFKKKESLTPKQYRNK